MLDSSSGLDRGFDVYADEFEGAGDEARVPEHRPEDAATPRPRRPRAGSRRRGGAPRQRFFLWLHLYDPHDPYEPPEPYATRFADRPYDGEVAFADELVGRLDAALARLWPARPTRPWS